MLRLKIDLTACRTNSKDPFWRLERNGILQKTILEYAAFLLRLYGITDVQPVAYLNGTLLPDTESPLILRDDDLLRIFPGKTSTEAQVVPSSQSASPEFLFQPMRDGHPTQNGQLALNSQPAQNGQPAANAEATDASISNGSYHTVLDCPGTSNTNLLRTSAPAENVSVTPDSDLSESAHHTKKRKRGKRCSRVRSKRVSFDVVDEVDENETRLMESTPFHNKVQQHANENHQSSREESLVEKQSEAYVTAIDGESPGVSGQSKKSLKLGKKSRKATAGMGYYLAMLQREPDANSIKDSVLSVSDESSANIHGEQGPPATSNEGNTDFDIATLEPNCTISCVIGLFNKNTSEVENYDNVQLLIIKNNTEKKSLTVKHLQGDIGENLEGSEFSVDWGMLSSVRLL